METDHQNLFEPETLYDSFLQALESQLMRSILGHPLLYATTLIQLGYEPLPPVRSKYLYIGSPIMVLPNKFSYVRHIYNVDGFTGCFSGLMANITSSLFSVCGYYLTVQSNLNSVQEAANNNNFSELIKWDAVATFTACVSSHPLYVLRNRQMAEFIGKETHYDFGIINGLYTIAKNEGIMGWFSGFMPRLVKEISALLIFYGIVLLIYRFTRAIYYQPIVIFGINFVIVSLTYPLQLVSVCMSVSGSELQAGSPPFMPDYSQNWIRCYDDLSQNSQLSRGKSLFWRQHIPRLT